MATELRRHFAQVSLIETEAFARAIRRRRAVITESGRLRWASSPTPKGAPIDDLVAHNIELVRMAHELRVEPARRLRAVLARSAPDRHDQPIEPSFLGDLELSPEAGGVTPKSQRVIAAAKP